MDIRISTILIAISLIPIQTIAQPILDFNVQPVFGNQMEYRVTDQETNLDPGDAGANQSWDLPFFSFFLASLDKSVVLPSSTPFAAKFPGAQYCIKTLIPSSPTKFEYYTKTDTSVQFLGQAFLGNIVYKNAPAWEQYYPMSFGDIKNGQFNGTLTIGTQVTYYRMQFQQEYDGFGSLSMGGALQYENSMRLKTSLTRIDSLPNTNGSHKRTVVSEVFFSWFVENHPGYVGLSSSYNTVQMTIAANGDTLQFQTLPTQYHYEWQEDLNVATNEIALNTNDVFTLSGNPSREWLTILPMLQQDMEAKICLIDINGRVLKQLKVNASKDIQIPVHDIAAGVYFVVWMDEQGVKAKQKWIKL